MKKLLLFLLSLLVFTSCSLTENPTLLNETGTDNDTPIYVVVSGISINGTVVSLQGEQGISGNQTKIEQWTNGHYYNTYDRVYDNDETDKDYDVLYVCQLAHTANTTNRPQSGVSWATFWGSGGVPVIIPMTTTYGVNNALGYMPANNSTLQAHLSDYNNPHQIKRGCNIKLISDDSILISENGSAYFTVPVEFNGLNLIAVQAHVYNESNSGNVTFNIFNKTDNVSMLLPPYLSIDANEKDSITANISATIDTGNDDITSADEIRIDCLISGNATQGGEIILTFGE